MKRGIFVSLAIAGAALAGFGTGLRAAKPRPARLVSPQELEWKPLMAAAGEKGPQLSVVFGDVKKRAPVGFLLKVPAGAKAGPHTHKSDYYAIMIKGTQHNFAPGEEASAKPLNAGSWWMQPGGIAHDNYCSEGSECLAFVYFPDGFDMKPMAGEAAAK